MSATFLKQYRGMCERGSTTLQGIDNAQRAKMLTAAEADQVREYWHTIYDILDLAIAVEGDRRQVVTWSAPNTAFHKVRVIRTAGEDVAEQLVNPTGDPATFPAPAELGEIEVQVTAQVVATTENNGVEVSGTALVPAAPEPEPEPEPTPEPEPETPAEPEPTPEPETPTEPEPTPEPTPETPAEPTPTEPTTPPAEPTTPPAEPTPAPETPAEPTPAAGENTNS